MLSQQKWVYLLMIRRWRTKMWHSRYKVNVRSHVFSRPTQYLARLHRIVLQHDLEPWASAAPRHQRPGSSQMNERVPQGDVWMSTVMQAVNNVVRMSCLASMQFSFILEGMQPFFFLEQCSVIFDIPHVKMSATIKCSVLFICAHKALTLEHK